eukprot:768761-Hanusia_phi.AAC.4
MDRRVQCLVDNTGIEFSCQIPQYDILSAILANPIANNSYSALVEIESNHLSVKCVKEYLYAPTLSIYSVTPSKVSTCHQTWLNILGSGFATSQGLTCKFGVLGSNDSFIHSATWISSSLMQCLMKPIPTEAKPIRLQIMQESEEIIGDGFTIFYEAPPTIFEAKVISNDSYDSHLLVRGQYFQVTDSAFQVKIGDVPCSVDQSHSNSTMIECSFSLDRAGNYSLQISNNGLDFVTLSHYVYFSGSEQLSCVTTPSVGPSKGGTQVVISHDSAMIAMAESLNCYFGDQRAEILSLTSSTVVVELPMLRRFKDTLIEISMSLTRTGKRHVCGQFYTFSVRNLYAEPSIGYVGLGSIVVLRLDPAFPPEITKSRNCACCIEDCETQGALATVGDQISCSIPPLSVPGTRLIEYQCYNVTIAKNEFAYVVLSQRLFQIVPSRGTYLGGTHVSLIGTNFMSTSRNFIYIGDAVLPLEALSSTLCVVITPAHKPGNVSIAVGSEQGVSSPFTFEFHQEQASLSDSNQMDELERYPTETIYLQPSFGPSTGGTRVAVVYGEAKMTPRKSIHTLNINDVRVSCLQRENMTICTTPPSTRSGLATCKIYSCTLGKIFRQQ